MDSDFDEIPCDGELGEQAFKSTLRMYFTIFVGSTFCVYKILNPWTDAPSSKGLTAPTVSDTHVTLEDGSVNGGLYVGLDADDKVADHCWLHCKVPKCTVSSSKEPGPCMVNWDVEENVLCLRFCPDEQMLASANFTRTSKGYSWESTLKLKLFPSDNDIDIVSELIRKRYGTAYVMARRLSFDGGHFNRVELHGSYNSSEFCQLKPLQFDRDFRKLKHLGEGSSGTVQMCLCLLDNNNYAVKVSRPRYGEFAEPWEVIVLSVLNHLNIIDMKVAWRESKSSMKTTYFVMERCDMSVDSILPLLPEDCNKRDEIFEQLITSVFYSHSRGALHRDIKTENVLFLGTVIKLVDFGDATLKMTPDESFRGGKLGTKGYTAPEVEVLSKTHTEKVDMYSAGITYYVIHCRRRQSFLDIWNWSNKLRTEGIKRTDPEFDDWSGDFDLLLLMVEHEPEKRISASDLLIKLSARRAQG